MKRGSGKVMQITSQSYSCQAEAWKWSTIYSPPPDFPNEWMLKDHAYDPGEFAALAAILNTPTFNI